MSITHELWLPVNLSMLFPGLGQFYTGETGKGTVFCLTEIALIAIAAWSIFAPTGNTLTGLILSGGVVLLYVINLFDVYLRGKRRAGVAQRSLTQLAQTTRNPWFAVFLSHVLPGLGQLYLQSVGWAAVLLASLILSSMLIPLFPSLIIFPPLIWAAACYHAYSISVPRRERSYRWILTVVVAMAILRFTLGYLPIWVNQSVYRFIVPSESMLPTLQVGDRMFVSQNSHYEPQMGDIIVFQAPQAAQDLTNATAETFFVKRVIATSGQSIHIRGGEVLINQQPLQEPYLSQPPRYEWGPEIVPPDAYFVLGDNRNASADSHVWGFLPAANIIGEAYKLYWPPARIRPID